MFFKKKKHNKRKAKGFVLTMLTLTLATPVMSTINCFENAVVYADENDSSTSSNSSSNTSSDSSSTSSDTPESKSNDELKTGVSKNKKGNDLHKDNLDDAKNDIYNQSFPSGARSALTSQSLKYNQGMQLLMTYSILKDSYGGSSYHTLMNGGDTDKLIDSLKKSADGISISIPKSFGTQDMLNMITASTSASDAVEKDKAQQIAGDTSAKGQDKNNTATKNGNADTEAQEALKPLAKVMAKNFLNACALSSKREVKFIYSNKEKTPYASINGNSGKDYANSGKETPSDKLVSAFEEQILKTISPDSSTANLVGKNDAETKKNIKNKLENLSLSDINSRSSLIIDAVGKNKMPADGGVYGNDFTQNSLKWYEFADEFNANSDCVVYKLNKGDSKSKDSVAKEQTQYLTPKNSPSGVKNYASFKKWYSNYKRLMGQKAKDNKDAKKAIDEVTKDDNIKKLVSNAKSDNNAKKEVEKSTKGLALLGWDYITPKLIDSNKDGNLTGATWKLDNSGKFMTAGENNDGKGVVGQVRFIIPKITGKATNDEAIFKIFSTGSVGFNFGQKTNLQTDKKRQIDSMIGYGNANNNLLDAIKNEFTGNLKLNNDTLDNLENGSGEDKSFNQNPAWKMQRYITGFGSIGSFSKDNATDAIGFDNYGNLIDGGTAKVIVPYWQNGLIPQFKSFTDGKSAYLANPILNDKDLSKMNGMKGVFGSGAGLVGKVTKKQIGQITKQNSDAYNNAVNVSKAVEKDNYKTAEGYISAVNKAVGESGKDKLSDKACQALAIDITAGTSDSVSNWNDKFLSSTGSEKHLYIGNSLTDMKNEEKTDSKKSKYNNLFTITDITQYTGLFFMRGASLEMRKTMVGLISNTYNTTFAQNQSQNVFYTPTFSFMSLFYQMPYVVAFIIAIMLILIVVVTYIEYAFLGCFGKSKIFTRVFLFLLVIPYFTVLHQVQMSLLNEAPYTLLNKGLKQEAILDQYANVRQETALNNVFYSALFGDRFSQINKSTSYAIPFYTTTQVDGQVDGTQGKSAEDALKDMNDVEKSDYLQSAFIKAQNNNGNGKLPFGTQYKYKKVYVASSDLLSWAIHMTRQKMSADGQFAKDEQGYETPKHGFKAGEEPLFTWLAEDYEPLGTTVGSDGKSINENKTLVTNALYGNGAGVMGYGGGDPTLPSIKENALKIYKRALADGASKEGAAAMVGNADQESSCNPNLDATAGYGIFQWTDDGNRRSNARSFAGKDVEKQVDYAFKEMNTNSAYKASLDAIKGHDIEKATDTFCSNFERAGNPQGGTRLQYAKKALEAFGNENASSKGDTGSSDSKDSNSSNSSDTNSAESYNPEDFWQKLNPAEGSMKSAYGDKGGSGASDGSENNNAEYYKDFDHYQEFMVQTNHKATKRDVQLGIDNSTTNGGWLSASQLFLKIWMTTFADDPSSNGKGNADRFNSLKNLAVAMNGYQNIPTGNAGTNYEGGDGETAKQFTQADRNALIDDLSETNEVRQKLHGQNYSQTTLNMMGRFNIPQPTNGNDWLNLDSDNSPLKMVLPYYGRYSGRSSFAYDVEKINKMFLNSYIDTYSLDRASLDPDGKDSTTGSTESYNKYNNTYNEDDFSKAEAQVMAIEEWFDINKVAGIKVFPTNYAPSSVSLDTFNRILFEPIGEVGKELTDSSKYNSDDYNNESPVRMQDNVIEYLSVRNNIFTLLIVLVMNILMLALGMVMMVLIKYILPIVSLFAFIRIFFSPKDDFKFKNLLIGSTGLILIIAFFKMVLSGAFAYMSTTMNQEYALAGTDVKNHTLLNAVIISLICIWFLRFIFKDWWGMIKQNGILSLGAGDNFKDYTRQTTRGAVKAIPFASMIGSAFGKMTDGRYLRDKARHIGHSAGRGLMNGTKKGFNYIAPKFRNLIARKKAEISNKFADSGIRDKARRQIRNSKLMHNLNNSGNVYSDLYHAERQGGKNVLHSFLNASIGAVGATLHGVKRSVLDNAIKGTIVQRPTRLGTAEMSLKSLSDREYNDLKKAMKDNKVKAKFNDDKRSVILPIDELSMKQVSGRAELFDGLLKGIEKANAKNFRIARPSQINRWNLGQDVLNEGKINLGHVSKFRAKQVMEEINNVLQKYDGRFSDYTLGDTQVDSNGNRIVDLKHVENLSNRQKVAIGEALENNNVIRHFLTPNESSSKYDRRLDLTGTGIKLSDEDIEKLASRGIRYMNNALFYNNHNTRQTDLIDDFIKQSRQNQNHNNLNNLGSLVSNVVANPDKAIQDGLLNLHKNMLSQVQYKVGDLNKAQRQVNALHKVGQVDYRLFNKAVNTEKQMDNIVHQAFINNKGQTDLQAKASAYLNAIQPLSFNGKSKIVKQLDDIFQQSKMVTGSRTNAKIDRMFNTVNHELSSHGMKDNLYTNLSKSIGNQSIQDELSSAIENTKDLRNNLFDKAHLTRSERNGLGDITPSYLQELSATANTISNIHANPDTNTISVMFGNKNSNLRFSTADSQRMSRLFKNT